MLSIQFINNKSSSIYKNGDLFKQETIGSSGIDLRAISIISTTGEVFNLQENEVFFLEAQERCLVKTGIKTQFDINYEIQIRSRSGLAWKNGIFVLNSPGTIDSDYRGEIGVILYNSNKEDFKINLGDRICQAVFMKIEKPKINFKTELENSERQSGGFGSTGK